MALKAANARSEDPTETTGHSIFSGKAELARAIRLSGGRMKELIDCHGDEVKRAFEDGINSIPDEAVRERLRREKERLFSPVESRKGGGESGTETLARY